MMPRSRRIRPAFLVTGALAALATAGAGTAQEIAGMAVDAEGRPLPEVPVALHRVGGGGGATVATGATDADGRFRFAVESEDSAVYFVAMRHGEQMYMGPPARAGAERVIDYVVRADESSEVGAVTSALTGGGARPLTPASGRPGAVPSGGEAGGGAVAVGLVAVLALAVAAVFVTTAPGYRRRQRRGLLIELARIENRLAAADPSAAAEEDRRLRAALRERLAPRT